ncbi:MAG: sugar-binding transcriptional regulator [Clostridia bacterium]|nr:sugar-binding transcriptional regulator [Clostridia bacterium]
MIYSWKEQLFDFEIFVFDLSICQEVCPLNYEESLMVKASWYYYFENMTQQAIADRLSISRMRVIKLLENARQTGVIQFRLRSDGVGMVKQSQQLINKYGLKDVFLIPEVDEDDSHPNESIARAGAMYIADRLSDNACINVGYGDTLGRTLNHLATMVQSPVTCISLTGGVSNYLPNTRSNVFNARLHLIPAPLLASSPEMAAAMRDEHSVSEVIRMSELSSFTLVGIGAMSDSATVLRSGVLTQADMFYLKMQSAVGDVLCHFLDKNGELIPSPIEDRLISTPLERLKAMNNVIGLAAGKEKIEAIRAVLRGGYLDILITDEPTANLLLRDE